MLNDLISMAFVRADVTAVKFHESRIFASIGSYTSIFEKGCLKELQTVCTLKGQKIYGYVVSKCGRKVLCYGGKQFTVLRCPESREELCARIFEPVVCDDWLHSAVWLDEDKVALLSAHNTVQLWDAATKTLISQHKSSDNSILYSGLLVPLENDVLVLAGTVFSEVILHCSGDEEPLQHLRGHRGVIFSISCSLIKKIIVTTSDDRSVRIWSPNTLAIHSPYTKEFWRDTTINCRHELYGHSARVMRNCIVNDIVVSVGEDGAICFWDDDGKLLRKTAAHQNSCIWSVDGDNDSLVTGGGDCGVVVHPLTLAGEYSRNNILETTAGVKKVVFTASKNIVMMTDDNLIYHNVETTEELQYKLNHASTYKLLSMSPCKQIIAVADMDGNLDVFIEHCKDNCLQNIITTKLQIEKILSMHWGDNRHLILCSQNGMVKVIAKGNVLEVICDLVLPVCKERWLTAAAIDLNDNLVILGDRCGNIHVYTKEGQDPIRTFRKVHGRYGPTSITIKGNEVISTGRDGTIRYFAIKDMEMKYMSCKNLEFQWVEKFLDKDENVVCGFHERDFVVYDIRNNCKMLDVSCGGGHRSWDAVRQIDINDEYEEFIKLAYVKNSDVHMASFQLSKIVSRNVINGSHCKEINCLKCFTSAIDEQPFYISGGEDTTLRLSSLDAKKNFTDRVLYKQLSNIRALKLYKLEDEKVILISAGGRAQICFNILYFNKKGEDINVRFEEVLDYQIKGTDKEKKGNQNWRNCSIDFDPETRIMDVEAIQCNQSEFLIFAGCSDAYLRIYKLNYEEKILKPVKELKYHNTCILKTHSFRLNDEYILITTTTRGEVTFWNVTNIEERNCLPFFTTTTNKSGVNSIDTEIMTTKNEVVIATGGDDNALHLVLIEIKNNLTGGSIMSSVHLDTLHSSQITGVCFSKEYLVTASIDQRVSLLKWQVIERKIRCEFLSQVFCDIADVQGIDLLRNSSNTITVCVYGKGMEVIEVSKQR